MKQRALRILIIFFVLISLAGAQDLASFEKRTTVKKLANGLTVLICERPEAPVFSFFTHVDAGSVQDPTTSASAATMPRSNNWRRPGKMRCRKPTSM